MLSCFLMVFSKLCASFDPWKCFNASCSFNINEINFPQLDSWWRIRSQRNFLISIRCLTDCNINKWKKYNSMTQWFNKVNRAWDTETFHWYLCMFVLSSEWNHNLPIVNPLWVWSLKREYAGELLRWLSRFPLRMSTLHRLWVVRRTAQLAHSTTAPFCFFPTLASYIYGTK